MGFRVWRYVGAYGGNVADTMENQIEKKRGHKMDTQIIWGLGGSGGLSKSVINLDTWRLSYGFSGLQVYPNPKP